MFFILSKITAFLLQPLCWFFALVLFGWLYKKGKNKTRIFSIAILMLAFFCNDFIVDEALRFWETPATKDKAIKFHKTGIVLGGMAGWDPQLGRVQFFGSADRLWQSLRLQKIGKIERLVVSGGSGKLLLPNDKEAKFIRLYLNEIKLNSKNIFYETESRNTHENAVNTAQILRKIGENDTVLLVTSGFHMRRASACFKAAGIPHHVYVTDRIVGGRKFEFDHLFIPSVGALAKWNLIIREWVGMQAYRIKSYV